jgi:predicted enzyme related to lactoylglutathione lyase
MMVAIAFESIVKLADLMVVGPFVVWWMFDGPADLAAAVERVRRAGGRALSPASARPWGEDVAYFADPDGNVIALAAPSP